VAHLGAPKRLILLAAAALLTAACTSGTSLPESTAALTSPVAQPSSTPATSTPPRASSATTTADPTVSVPTPTTASLLAEGASGDQVRMLQARLKQLDYFDATVDGAYGPVTTSGVRGFQTAKALPATGAVDQATWDQLLASTKQPSAEDLAGHLIAGPALLRQGSTGAKVADLQARLKQIGWWSGDVTTTYGPQTAAAVKGFQDKRGIPATGDVDQRTLDRLYAMTRKPTSDELNNVKPKPVSTTLTTAGLDPRCLTGHVMCISKTTRKLVWVVDGTPIVRVDVRVGSQELPTREGVFHVFQKSRDHVSTLYHTSMPYAMFFSGGQAVHYSPDFAARGYSGASHGCVNVRDLRTITWLFDQVHIGDAVVIYW
jgi:peptidoglycan hydrolase-like protein with peptidoglycan-binding domain